MWKFMSWTSDFILHFWESEKVYYNFHFVWYRVLISWFWIISTLGTKITLFSQNQVLPFLTYIVIQGVDMLPKRSTHVDKKSGIWKYTLSAFCSYFYSFQNVRSCSEILKRVSNTLKTTKSMATSMSGHILARYMKQKVRLVQGKNDRTPFFGDFFINVMLQWLQELSGSSKNSWK